MPEVIGYDEKVKKKITCSECSAIVQYVPKDVYWNNRTDEGCKIMGFNCPGCGKWIRTNN